MPKIFLNSMPKSGTNFVAKAFDRCTNLRYTNKSIATTSIHGKHSRVKKLLRGTSIFSKKIDVGLDLPTEVSLGWLNATLSVKENTYLTGHTPYSKQLANELINKSITPIIILRDPVDTFLSFHNHILTQKEHFFHKQLKAIDEFEQIQFLLEAATDSSGKKRSFREMLMGMHAWEKFDGAVILKFEDLIGDLGGGCNKRQVTEFAKLSEVLKVSICTNCVRSTVFGKSHTYSVGKISGRRPKYSHEIIEHISKELHDQN